MQKSVLTFRSEEYHYCHLSRTRGQLTNDASDDAFTRITQEPKTVQQLDFPQLYFSLKGNHFDSSREG